MIEASLRAVLRVVARRQVWVSIPFATSRIIVSPRYMYRIPWLYTTLVYTRISGPGSCLRTRQLLRRSILLRARERAPFDLLDPSAEI